MPAFFSVALRSNTVKTIPSSSTDSLVSVWISDKERLQLAIIQLQNQPALIILPGVGSEVVDFSNETARKQHINFNV